MKDEISSDMLSGFNCSRKQLNDILPCCRIVIEEFLYEKIYGDLFSYKGSMPSAENLNDLADEFKQTASNIVRLSCIIAPSLQVLQIYKIVTSFDY